ncbi:Rossmann-fold NAD(P)-binding domain-containing protein [Mesomycoplasma neurolyticum]|uniref:UDP-glucose 6-dehydrogenase n=1 Tax=Mesomycoplasma neurolyticum TaxID=2120 RepID=A0A449A5U7_9BACT|nr:UDP-glucose/GDP-mannose dehydrogenase family protein [Mesomycoplasma neurolyticum]VEU59631.1 UDP-glucose 6-dehydrogenase [Mesomycoplasma neurolyticum]
MLKTGIIGYGVVGKAMKSLFTDSLIYDIDPKLNKDKNVKIEKDIKKLDVCDAVFICVPTNQKKDGSCDTSIVEEIIAESNAKLFIIRSTVEIGFTKKMVEKYKKLIVFQPEYYGETIAHPFTKLSDRNWITLGGGEKARNLAIKIYQKVINSNVKIYQCSSDEAELAKYMENAFLATKVTFCNEMYEIAKKLNINYNIARELWIADPRIGSSHTFVYEENRGYGGKCLPKDIASLQHQFKINNIDSTLISAVIKKNKKFTKNNK